MSGSKKMVGVGGQQCVIRCFLVALLILLGGNIQAGIEDGEPSGLVESYAPLILKANANTVVTFTVRNTSFTTYFRVASGTAPPGWAVINNTPEKKMISGNKTATFSFTINPGGFAAQNIQLPVTLYADNVSGIEQVMQTGFASFEVMAPPDAFSILQPIEDQVLEGPYSIVWGGPANADTYTLEVKRLNGNTPVNPPVIRVTNTTHTFYSGDTSALQKGAFYQIEVTAKNEVGETKNSGGPRHFSVAPPLPLGAFSITSPANNSVVGTNPFFSWGSSANATSYRLRVYGEFNGAPATGSPIRTVTQTQLSYTYADPPLARGLNYYVTVVALGEAGEKGSDSNFVKFSIPAIEPFTLISPPPEATKVARVVSFKWNAAVGASTYGINIYDETSSGRQLYVTGGVNQAGSTLEYFLPANKPLLANHRYSWEVTAFAGIASRKNDDGIRFFNTLQMTSFGLLSPGHDRKDVSQAPTFDWQATPGASYYNVELAPSDTQGNIIPGLSQISPSVNGTNWTSTFAPLTKGKKYFWRVFATDGVNSIVNDGGWRPFVVDPLTDFSLLSPADDAESVEISPQLKWELSTGAIGYAVRISIPNVIDFDPIVVEGNIDSIDLLDHDIQLNGDTTYTWSVDAVSEGSLRACISPRSFTTTFRTVDQFTSCDIIQHLLGQEHFSSLDRLVIGSFAPPLDVGFYHKYISVGNRAACE
ncbi:hypothetical protein IT570_10210 [Candidatus Sumerlaeota bacterium]|nr:hypothetical protein [Candidatus Sumerlaeota bacterium]